MDESVASQSNTRRGGERRRRRFSFVLHERRSGFDRRELVTAGPTATVFENTLTGLRDHPGTLWVLLVTVNVLNLADFALTLNVLALGGGEANPIMRSLFALNPAYAGTFKIMAVLVTSGLVWRCRRFRSALGAALLMLAIFAGVFFYHIIGWTVFG
ncbi:MAG: DUF5658 family protein [bacterium]